MKESIAGILRNEEKILLMKRKPGGTQGGRWEIPGGKLESGEKPEEAMIREWEEETGEKVYVGYYLGSIPFDNKGENFKVSAYEVFTENEVIFNPDSLPEHDDWGWFSPEEALQLEEIVPSDKDLITLIFDD